MKFILLLLDRGKKCPNICPRTFRRAWKTTRISLVYLPNARKHTNQITSILNNRNFHWKVWIVRIQQSKISCHYNQAIQFVYFIGKLNSVSMLIITLSFSKECALHQDRWRKPFQFCSIKSILLKKIVHFELNNVKSEMIRSRFVANESKTLKIEWGTWRNLSI